jgi:hypothetical protein
MAVTGATQLPDEVEAVPVPRGRYRVRVVYAQTDHRPAKFNPETPETIWNTSSRCDRPTPIAAFVFSSRVHHLGRTDEHGPEVAGDTLYLPKT